MRCDFRQAIHLLQVREQRTKKCGRILFFESCSQFLTSLLVYTLKVMRKISPSVSKPLFVIVTILILVCGSFAFWLLNRAPNHQQVFWQTIENNLSSRSVSFETQIEFDSPDQSGELILDNRLDLSFETQPSAHFKHQILFYDHNIAQQTDASLQTEQYFLAGLEKPPEQEWYAQEGQITQEAVWIRHDLYTQPPNDNWNRLFGQSFVQVPLGAAWKEFKLDDNEYLDWQRFLMATSSSSGFFYGRLNSQERAGLMELLRQAYKVDFTQARSFSENGRQLYEYQVSFDQAALGRAFVYYFNAHISDSNDLEKLELPPNLLNNIFRFEGLTHKLVVDVRARQIAYIDYPIAISPGWSARDLTEDFVVVPLFSPIVRDAVLQNFLPLRVRTRIVAQNQRLVFPVPAGVLRTEDAQPEEIDSGESAD